MYDTAPMTAVQGMVMTQAVTICRATLQWTALMRYADPTPKMDPETTCVVETGRWSKVAEKMTTAEFKSAAKPWTGCILNILPPTVRIIFQPPTLVPKAMDIAQRNLTRSGTSRLVMKPPDTRARVMIPMDFWASLEPWEKAIRAADTTCNLLAAKFTLAGLKEWQMAKIIFMMMKPVMIAETGEMMRDKTIFMMPQPFRAATPADTMIAPIMPPMRA